MPLLISAPLSNLLGHSPTDEHPACLVGYCRPPGAPGSRWPRWLARAVERCLHLLLHRGENLRRVTADETGELRVEVGDDLGRAGEVHRTHRVVVAGDERGIL